MYKAVKLSQLELLQHRVSVLNALKKAKIDFAILQGSNGDEDFYILRRSLKNKIALNLPDSEVDPENSLITVKRFDMIHKLGFGVCSSGVKHTPQTLDYETVELSEIIGEYPSCEIAEVNNESDEAAVNIDLNGPCFMVLCDHFTHIAGDNESQKSKVAFKKPIIFQFDSFERFLDLDKNLRKIFRKATKKGRFSKTMDFINSFAQQAGLRRDKVRDFAVVQFYESNPIITAITNWPVVVEAKVLPMGKYAERLGEASCVEQVRPTLEFFMLARANDMQPVKLLDDMQTYINQLYPNDPFEHNYFDFYPIS